MMGIAGTIIMKISPISSQQIFKSNKIENKNKQNNTSEKKIQKTATAYTILTLLLYLGVNGMINKNNSGLIIPFDANKTSISEIAKTYNVKEEAIMAYNNIQESSEITGLSEIKLPQNFDYIQEKINIMQRLLHSTFLSVQQRQEYEKEIQALLRKQKEQKNVANVFADKDSIYININIDDSAPEYIRKRYSLGINIESLKKLFDIKDGAIENNNELNAQWVATNSAGDKGYYDYTLNWFHNGDIIKIPKNSIDINNINLSKYISE